MREYQDSLPTASTANSIQNNRASSWVEGALGEAFEARAKPRRRYVAYAADEMVTSTPSPMSKRVRSHHRCFLLVITLNGPVPKW